MFKILNRTVTCRSIVLACGMEMMVGLRLDADEVNDVARKEETIHYLGRGHFGVSDKR